MKKLLYAMVVVAVVGTLLAQDAGEPRGVETNAQYSLWVIRGANGVCATVLDLDGRRYLRPAPGYTIEVVHDDRRTSAPDPFEATQPAPAMAFPADPVNAAKKGK